MKKLTALDDRLAPVSLEDEPKVDDKMPTYRKVYLSVLGNAKAKTADDARRAARIAIKLRSSKEPSIDIDETDLTALKLMIEQNALNLVATVQGQALIRLDEDGK
jgi:hypothetical protein